MKHYYKIIDELCKQKDMLCKGMSDEEIKEIDIYLEEVVKELEPLLKDVEDILENPKRRKKVGNLFKREIRNQRWQEKLSKTT